MNIQEAFSHAIEQTLKGAVPKSTHASYKRRLERGELKEETMRELLLKHGYEVVAEEEWAAPGEKFFNILFLDKSGKLAVKTLQAESSEQACSKVAKQDQVSIHQTEDATGASPRKIARLSNKLLSL